MVITESSEVERLNKLADEYIATQKRFNKLPPDQDESVIRGAYIAGYMQMFGAWEVNTSALEQVSKQVRDLKKLLER